MTMTWQDVDITSNGTALSFWPPVLYYAASIVIGLLLCIIRNIVRRYACLATFVLYRFFLGFIGSLQLSIMSNGIDFSIGTFRVYLDIYTHDSVSVGALIFFFLYCFIVPVRMK
ncbi:hypothetical protein ABC733_02060 [Mangrovibacter sp. SLW1]